VQLCRPLSQGALTLSEDWLENGKKSFFCLQRQYCGNFNTFYFIKKNICHPNSSSGKSKLKAHDYLSVISKTLLFYEAQRASDPNGFKNVPWRANATLQDNSDDANLAGGFFDGAGRDRHLILCQIIAN
jgi:hypothetical protein